MQAADGAGQCHHKAQRSYESTGNKSCGNPCSREILAEGLTYLVPNLLSLLRMHVLLQDYVRVNSTLSLPYLPGSSYCCHLFLGLPVGRVLYSIPRCSL